MARRPIPIRVVRDLPFPQAQAYAWLTEFGEDDAQRTEAVLKTRRIVESTSTRCVYEGETEALGRRIFSRTEVTLLPPDRWHAMVTQGPRTGSETRYRLESTGAGSCRLVVDYDFRLASPVMHVVARAVRPLLARSLERMWDGFAASMARDLTADPTRGATAAASSPRA